MKLRTRIVYFYNRFLRYFINFKILNNDESIDIIKNSNKSLARYGDGEMLIINNGYINFQKYNEELANRLKEILLTNDENIMIGIPIAIKSTNGYNKVAKEFWNQNMDTGRMHWKKYCKKGKIYCNTNMTRLFRDYEDKSNSIRWFKEFKQIWSNKEVLLVEGTESRLGVNNDLFDNANLVERIIAPPNDAYDKYDKILNCIRKNCKDKLVLLSLGPTATVLAYDLCRSGIRALDIGHIQLEYNEFCEYVKENKIDIQESGEELSYEEYKKQIIFEV